MDRCSPIDFLFCAAWKTEEEEEEEGKECVERSVAQNLPKYGSLINGRLFDF